MKLIVVMPIGSPWAREFVIRLVENNLDVLIIDIATSNRKYLSKANGFQSSSIEKFLNLNIKIISVSSNYGYYVNLLKAIFKIRKLSEEFNPDGLLVLYGGLWGLISYLANVNPLYVYIVGSDILLGNSIKRSLTRIVLNNSQKVFSNGINLGKVASKIAPKAKIINNYLGVDTDRFKGSCKNISKSIKYKIVCTRGFEKVYNNDFLLEGLSLLSDDKLKFIEVTYTSTGSLLNNSISKARMLFKNRPFLNSIKFLNGVNDINLIEILQESDIYVSFSFSDGSSISLMEAMACELFPILSDIPANREWVENNGILIKLDNPNSIAVAVEKIIDGEMDLNDYKLLNREIILAKADARKNISIFLSELCN